MCCIVKVPLIVGDHNCLRPDVLQGVTLLSAIGDAVKGKAATLSNAAIANIEEARGVATSANDFAGEATSLVKVRQGEG